MASVRRSIRIQQPGPCWASTLFRESFQFDELQRDKKKRDTVAWFAELVDSPVCSAADDLPADSVSYQPLAVSAAAFRKPARSS